MGFVKDSIASLLAGISMYSRLPAWRLMPLNEKHYQRAVYFLPLVGFLTGGLMAVVFYLSYHYLALPLLVSLIIALSARLIFTGAFHEDGLGDFFDGFGGGRDKESILRIMKDSHVGSYAVIGYVMYYSLLIALLSSIPSDVIPLSLLVADILGKCCVLILIELPYARKSEESKIQLIYANSKYNLITLALYISALGLCFLDYRALARCIIFPLLFAMLFKWYVKRKLGGYTGDTCGAIILLGELVALFSLYYYFLK